MWGLRWLRSFRNTCWGYSWLIFNHRQKVFGRGGFEVQGNRPILRRNPNGHHDKTWQFKRHFINVSRNGIKLQLITYATIRAIKRVDSMSQFDHETLTI